MNSLPDWWHHPKPYAIMDCLDGMKALPDKCVDLVLTDPPYGMEFRSNYRKVKYDKIEGDDKFPIEAINEMFRIAKKAVYIFCRWDNLVELPMPKSVLAWVKNNWSMGDLEHEHGRQWEAICFYPMEEHEFIKRIPDVIFYPRTGNIYHPTEKPVGLMEVLINSNVGNIIFDPFLGSGTTLLAGRKTGRTVLGFEIEPDYEPIIRKRMMEEIPKLEEWF